MTKKYDLRKGDNMANSGKKATGVVLSIIVIIAIMAVKFVGINTLVHYLKFG
ncbi:hypothetical protein BB14905_18430 [Bacillus sp. B14905]|nr:hypothetical protein BB14905_18430 [Bacillus sp. B14905]